MFRNRYLISALTVLFVLVAAYNASFFLKRRDARRQADAPQTTADRSPAPLVLPVPETVSGSSWKRDPFWYPDTGQKTGAGVPAKEADSGGFRLVGTMTRDGKGYALISGRIVGVGERVEGHEILAVGNSTVTIRTGSSTKTLRLLGDTEKKE